MAATEQRIPGVGLRAETFDQVVKLTAEEWAQVKPTIFDYAAQQEAIAARPDILGEAKAAREAKRAALGPMPTNLKSAKAYTEAFLERWGDRGLEKPPLVADFGYMTTEIARETSSQLDLMMRTFPNTADSLWASGSSNTMRKVDRMPLDLRRAQKPNVMADASSVGTLRWNPTYFGKTGEAVKRGRGSAEPAIHHVQANGFRFHVPLGEDPATVVSEARSTVAHEFGHLMDYEGMRRTPQGQGARDRVGEYAARMDAILNDHLKAHRLATGRHMTMTEMISEELSEYGSTNLFETMAEATCEVMCSPNPRPLARKLLALVREYAEGIPADHDLPGLSSSVL
jgi:hypothetical protein